MFALLQAGAALCCCGAAAAAQRWLPPRAGISPKHGAVFAALLHISSRIMNRR